MSEEGENALRLSDRELICSCVFLLDRALLLPCFSFMTQPCLGSFTCGVFQIEYVDPSSLGSVNVLSTFSTLIGSWL
ncbi:hypothetical protein SCA6_010995 [Theobroma cacao]